MSTNWGEQIEELEGRTCMFFASRINDIIDGIKDELREELKNDLKDELMLELLIAMENMNLEASTLKPFAKTDTINSCIERAITRDTLFDKTTFALDASTEMPEITLDDFSYVLPSIPLIPRRSIPIEISGYNSDSQNSCSQNSQSSQDSPQFTHINDQS